MSNVPPNRPGGQYPPAGDQYPPQRGNTGPLNPQQGYPPPQRGNTGPLNPQQQGYPPTGQPPLSGGYNPPAFQSTPPPNLAPRSAKRLGTDEDLDSGRSAFMESFSEHRIEYLAWGSVVLLAGFAIILLAIDPEGAFSFLRIVAPLLGGSILLASGLLQRVGFGYGVSPFTWAVAILGVALGLTQLMAMMTDQKNDLTTQGLYFTGLMVIISGMVIILQVFRKPESD